MDSAIFAERFCDRVFSEIRALLAKTSKKAHLGDAPLS